MKQLQSGQHFGANKRTLRLQGTILTEAGYTPHIEVPWHYHENAYFFYHLKGHLLEVSRKKEIHCTSGTLLFHHWQDPHYDTAFSKDASFFHIELEKKWFTQHYLNPSLLEGSVHLQNPAFQPLFHKIYTESKVNDTVTQLSVDGLLLQSFATLLRYSPASKERMPRWVLKAKEILEDQYSNKITLNYLSSETGIHPVHLSREFAKYFHMSFGEYLRSKRLQKAMQLLLSSVLSLTDITYQCGFSDQSHFTRCFKEANGITPSQYRKIMRSR